MTDLKINDPAPDFALPTDGGGTLSLASQKGMNVVLFFYPKDNTSGCTKEAIGFSETIDEFENCNTVVFGVSKDSVKSHDRFVEKQGLKTKLISDEELEIIQGYGVWKEKSMYGRKFMGVERTTFLIDKEGKIAKIWRKVKVAGHVEEVLEAAKNL